MKKHPYACDVCDFTCATVPEIASHKRWQHPKQANAKKAALLAKEIEKSKKKTPAKKSAIPTRKKRGRKLRQEKSQHIPRPENFAIAGCGVEIYYEHLTYIPDLENDTVEYLDKERVCRKCRKRYKLDEALRKRRRK